MHNLLFPEETFKVRTKSGAATVLARPLTRSANVIFLTRSRKFGRGSNGVKFSEGTPLVRNLELVRVTGGKKTHMVVEHGLYHLFRQAAHIATGTERDLASMLTTRRSLTDFADFIRYSGQLPLDYHEKVAELLEEIGDELDLPKRNPHKLNTAKRSKQAANTRYNDGRIKPGPGRIVTAAASIHAQKRIHELRQICPAVNYTMVRVWTFMNQLHSILDHVWSYFTSNVLDGLPVTIRTAMAKQSRDRESVDLSCAELDFFEMSMHDSFFVQPFTQLAPRVIQALGTLRRAIKAHRRDRVPDEVRRICKPLRRLRMIRYIELKLLPALSSVDRVGSREQLLVRHDKALARLRDMKDDELDERLRKESIDFFELFREDLENEEPESARKHLIDLEQLLATA